MKEQFFAFLKEQGAYGAWMVNTSEEDYNLDDLFNLRPPSDWITSVFYWEDSPEDHDYWYHIHVLWIERLKSFK